MQPTAKLNTPGKKFSHNMFTQQQMEKLLEKFFSFSYYVLSIPYRLEWKPNLHVTFRINKTSSHYYLWLARLLVKFLHTIVAWIMFVYLLPSYLQNKHFDYLAFHCEWGMVCIFTLVHQFPHLTSSEQVIQLSNTVVHLIDSLEKGKMR